MAKGILLVISMIALLVAGSVLLSGPASARQACGDRTAFLEKLAGRYSETPRAVGLTADGSWTILVSHPNRRTCVAASGEHWETIPKVAVGPSA